MASHICPIVRAGRAFTTLTLTAAMTQVIASAADPTMPNATEPPHWKWAAKPPMGWNSYDAWGTSVTESETLENARFMREKLLSHGWQYIVIDARWYDSISSFDDRDFNKERSGAKLFADEFGRVTPATNRFPSAANGKGFKPLADQIHAMGLKLGFHMMRGIPRQAVRARTPIEGSPFTAADAGDPKSTCGWCPDMFGVRNTEAGQAWYDACARLWAAWGIDFVKVDDLSSPYYASEIAMIRKALDKCGRPIVLSTSAGPTPVAEAKHVSTHANMWRISGDFWDIWGESHRSGLNHQFDLLAQWQGVGGPGHWPDADMIPLGHIGIKCTIAGPDRQTRFTRDEQRTLMSLWAIAPSPLMLGNHLPDTDEWTLSLLTNDEVLAVNQDALGNPARRVTQGNGTEIWVKTLEDGGTAVGLFNRSAASTNIELGWTAVGLTGKQTLRNLWTHKDLGRFDGEFSAEVPAHGVLFMKARGDKAPSQLQVPKTPLRQGSAAQTSMSETGRVTYTLHRPKEPTAKEQTLFDQIDKSTQAAVGYYNRYTRLQKHLTVTYNSGVPTADGNINGSIRIGGLRNTRVLLHEIGHCMGVGQHRNWGKLRVRGLWQGEHANKLLQEMTNDPNAQLNGDRMHFWPYGLNYDNEVKSEEDLIRHAKLVEAMVTDMETAK